MEYVHCNLCGGDETDLWGRKDGLNIVQCRHCGLVYTNPRLDAEKLSGYYDAAYFEDRTPEADAKRYEMYRLEVEEIVRTVGQGGRFLDVGCANGIFLSVLGDSFERYGLDSSAIAVEAGRTRYSLDLRAGTISSLHGQFPPGYFDVVHLRAVLEHMQNPVREIAAANGALRSAAWLIISTTPNIESPCGRLYRERFRLVFPKEHIYYFSPRTLERLLEMTGFTAVRWTFPYLETPYADLERDGLAFVENYEKGEESPPYWASVMTVYARKIRPAG